MPAFRFLLLALAASVSSAATYHVSPAGDDTRDGLTPATAWRTLAKVNASSFQPGDRLLLEGGATFSDSGLHLGPDDAGDHTRPFLVSTYGTGRARIRPDSDQHHPAHIHNTAGLILENLILEGVGRDTSTRTGLLIFTDLPANTRLCGITVRDCEISHTRLGVELAASSPDASFSGFDSVLLERLLVHTCRRDGIITHGQYPGSPAAQSHRDVTIRLCEIRHVTGDPAVTEGHGGSGIILSGVQGGLVDLCYAHHNGGSHGTTSGGGPVGIWTWNSDSVVIQRSVVHHQRTKEGVKDGGGFDVDGGATNALVQYNLSFHNEGPGYLVAEFDHAPPLAHAIFRRNISWLDGRRTSNRMAGGFHFWKGAGSASTVSDIQVYQNLVYTDNATGGPAVSWEGGPMSGIHLRQNLFIISGGERFVEINNDDARAYFTFRDNLYWAVDGDLSGGWLWGSGPALHSLSAWRAATLPLAPR